VPSTLPFGSAPEIAIVTQKMAATAILKIKQPNQEYLPDIICTPEVGTDGMIYRAPKLHKSVTNTHGRAEYQVIFVLADGEQIGTYAGTFNVARGVPIDFPSSEEALRDYALAEVYQLLANVAEVGLLADALNTYTGIGTVLETEAKNLAGAINELFARPIFRVDKTLTIEGHAADAKATGERIVKSIDDHNKDGNAHEGILEKLDDLDTEVLNVKGDVKILKETTATDDEVALAVSEHNQSETAHPAIRSAITEVSNEVKNLNVDGKIADALFSHNTNTEAHNDIRIVLQELFDQVNHFLDVDDTKKDQLSELLALIDENIEDIENIVANNVKYNDIIDNLTTNLSNKVLSAAQGVELKRLIEEVRTAIGTAINAHNYDGNAHAGIREDLDDIDTEVRDLKTKVTALENAKPDMSGYVTTEQFETALGAYITDIDSLVGSGA
jgi:CHASE3 domain sensor protein